MAKYLSPGVYVEEFDPEMKPMEGVATSTARFIGMAEKGPVQGPPRGWSPIFRISRELLEDIFLKGSTVITVSFLMRWNSSL